GDSVRGGAVWQLVGLITRRSQVQILPPLPASPRSKEQAASSGLFLEPDGAATEGRPLIRATTDGGQGTLWAHGSRRLSSGQLADVGCDTTANYGMGLAPFFCFCLLENTLALGRGTEPTAGPRDRRPRLRAGRHRVRPERRRQPV